MERKKVLICDDEEGIRESLKLILEDSYDLAFATNGSEAIETAKQVLPDIVILDIKMPKMSGIDALKEIKKALPKAKFVISSGYKSVEVAQEAIKQGASEYIVKPFESEEILKTLGKL